MEFVETATDENFTLTRFESVNKKWEFGFRVVFAGARFGANPVGAKTYTLEYCAGANELFAIALREMMFNIFNLLPEEITDKEMSAIFPPHADIKPMCKDASWQLLKILRQELKTNKGDYKKIPAYKFKVTPGNDCAYIKLLGHEEMGNATVSKTEELWTITEFQIQPQYRVQGFGTYFLQALTQKLWQAHEIPININPANYEDWTISWFKNMGFNQADGIYTRKILDYDYGLFRYVRAE